MPWIWKYAELFKLAVEGTIFSPDTYTKGLFFTLCCWEAAVYAIDKSWKKMDVKIMMMMM